VIPEKDAPRSLHGIAELLAKRPDLKNRLSTQNVAVPFGRAAQWSWAQHNKDAWTVFGALGPSTRPERAVGTIIEKITTGEYAMAWFVNASALFDKLRDPTRRSLIGWSFIEDGTPLVPRRLAIPATSKHNASARLMLDYLVSKPGQKAMGATGVTSYRSDVQKNEVLDYTYQSIVDEAGAANVALEQDDQAYAKDRDAFVARWRETFNQSK
jgi:iron(III) transport system substrate-binding protein